MNEDTETSPLLGRTQSPRDGVCTESSFTKDTSPTRTSGRRRYIPLEPIMSFYFVSYFISMPVYQFYIYSSIAKSHGIDNFVAGDEQKGCNASTDDVIVDIQKEANKVFVNLSFAGAFAAVVPTLFLGSISDKFGRKVSLLVTLTGMFIRHVLFLIVMQWELPFELMYLGNIIEGLSGYFGSAIMVAFSIMADITIAGKERAFRISLIDCLMAVSAGLSLFGGGVWIKFNNFVIPMIFATLLCLVTIVLVVIFIPRTNHFNNGDHQKKICSFDNIKRCFVFYYKDNGKNRRGKLILLQMVFALSAASHFGKTNVFLLFLLNLPFCWSELHINVYVAVQLLVNWACSIILLKVVLRFLRDVSVLIIASVFAVGAYALLGFASADWMVYLYAVLSTFTVISIPMLRAIMSRLAEPDEQGALFAGIACIEMLLIAIAGIIYGVVYQFTVTTLPGTVFLVMTGMMLIVTIASGFLQAMMKDNQYKTPKHIAVAPSTSSSSS